MNHDLPGAVERYVAGKNARDFAAAAAAFTDSAVVKDEGQSREGPAAIRAWMEETASKYNDHTEVETAVADGAAVEVTARVSGTFPGSPVRLRYRFTLEGERISRLEIAA